MVKTLGTKQHAALIEFLVERRQQIMMTQDELADHLGEYQSFVARMESGQRRVDVVEFIRLAKILRFDAQDAINAINSIHE